MTSSSSISSVVLSRYAGALIDVADKAKAVDKVAKDFDAIVEILADSKDFFDFTVSPMVSRSGQAAVLADFAKKGKFNKITSNFLNVLVQNRRLNALPGIVGAYQKIMDERAGKRAVRVESAVALTVKQQKDFKVSVEKALGVDVSVDAVVVPEIMGGMIVTIGSYMIDDSVRRKLERLGSALKQNTNGNVIQNLKEVV